MKQMFGLAALGLALSSAGCADWTQREIGHAWLGSICREANAQSDYCRERGYPPAGLTP